MRRYTTVKSNAHAPLSTDILSQNMIHSQLANHYRMMYFASSRVDTSPPWKYKTCDFLSPDRMRRKTKKRAARPTTAIEAYRGELDLQSRSLVDRILYDTKQPPTAYTNDCVARRHHVTGQPKRKDVWCSENYKNEAPNYIYPCEDKTNVLSSNTTLNKQRQIPQFKGTNGQMSKKKICYIKRNSIYGKHKSTSHERLRENIPLSLAKSRIYHPLRSPCTGFQDVRGSFSSGSEGNAGDDEDGTPTSSCNDSNLSLKDCQKHTVLRHKVSLPDSDSPHKGVMKKGKRNPCVCLASIKETENAGSRVSSRDSAYEGGEGMSTENQRNSPDECENGSKWFYPSVAENYVKEGEEISLPPPQEGYLFSGKSELYMKFLQDVTDDVLVQGVYANEGLERIFQDHIDNNEHGLDLDHLKLMIEKLKEDLGIPAKTYAVKQMHNDGAKKKPKISHEIFLDAKNDLSVKITDIESEFNNVMRTQFGNNETGYSWTKKQTLDKQKNLASFIIIDQNISLTKGEVIDFLSDVGFDDSISEEIFHILSGKCDVAP